MGLLFNLLGLKKNLTVLVERGKTFYLLNLLGANSMKTLGKLFENFHICVHRIAKYCLGPRCKTTQFSHAALLLNDVRIIRSANVLGITTMAQVTQPPVSM